LKRELLLIRRILIVFILLASAIVSHANEVSQQLSVKIKHIEYIVEDQVRYDFPRIRSFDQSRWLSVSQYPLNLGNLEQGAWGRFTLTNVEDVQLERVLEFANPRLHRLSIYIESSTGTREEWQLGNHLPFKEREIFFRNFSLPLVLQAKEEMVVYFRAQSNVGMLLPINLHKEGEFWRLANNENLAYGFYFGILIMFVVFNVSLYLARNNYLYILLAIDLSVFSLMYANHLGLNFEYLWPVDPQFNYLASLFLGYMVILTANVFTWHFLQLTYSKRLQKTFYLFNVLPLAGIVLLWILPAKASSFICAILGIAIAIYLAMLTTKNRYRQADFASYYIASYFVAAIATCVYIAHKLALLPTNFLTNYAIGGSILLQAIVLTCVLLERKKVVEKVVGFHSPAQSIPDSAKDWIAQFSHEVRTPLNGIIGMVDLLKETPLNPTQYGYIRTLSSSGKYLLDLVSDELDYGNLTRGTVELNEAPFNLEVLCKQCCSMLEQQAADSQVTIELNFSPTMPVALYGDEKCLKQIIINLLSNSIKFTHHGKVVISAEYSKSNHLILSVWDDGIGITKQQQLKIFDRFCQGDSSVYSRYGGSGLGLAICRQLANLMGGEITVDSRVGKYCSFTIDLPLAVCNEALNTAENSENVELKELSSLLPSNRELIVLGVDDNEINRRVLSAMLKKLGHRMIEATSGQQAIDIARSGQALDLILMDCEMPGMNGFEATEVIRKWQHGQAGEDCPIVALTAHVLTEHIEKCLAAGMNAHLSKPLHLNQLRELLESLGAENK
jgi:signal transduction histidine kinase/CheY-like chemotaxis protein